MPFSLLHFTKSGLNSMMKGIFMDDTGTMVREDGAPPAAGWTCDVAAVIRSMSELLTLI